MQPRFASPLSTGNVFSGLPLTATHDEMMFIARASALKSVEELVELIDTLERQPKVVRDRYLGAAARTNRSLHFIVADHGWSSRQTEFYTVWTQSGLPIVSPCNTRRPRSGIDRRTPGEPLGLADKPLAPATTLLNTQRPHLHSIQSPTPGASRMFSIPSAILYGSCIIISAQCCHSSQCAVSVPRMTWAATSG